MELCNRFFYPTCQIKNSKKLYSNKVFPWDDEDVALAVHFIFYNFVTGKQVNAAQWQLLVVKISF